VVCVAIYIYLVPTAHVPQQATEYVRDEMRDHPDQPLTAPLLEPDGNWVRLAGFAAIVVG
jgi:hypothetical protein